MNTSKQWYLSKTIWGSIIAVGAALASVFGFDIDSSSQVALTDSALQIVTVIASLFAVLGRLNATSIIE